MAGMVEEIRRLKFANPFVPFKIRTTGGEALPIYTKDYVGTLPGRKRVIVFAQDDTFKILWETSIDALEPLSSRKDVGN